MAEVELTGDVLIVHGRGMDQLWALKSRLEIPLAHVVGAKADAEAARGWRKGIRAPGTHIPGVIAAGTFYREGEKVFWDVHDPAKAIRVELEDEGYARLVTEVDDPGVTDAAIRAALGEE